MVREVVIGFSGALTGLIASAQQVQTEPPADLITFQWIVITALCSAVGVLYWQNVKVRESSNKELFEVHKLYNAALSVNTEAMRELKHAITDVASLSRLDQRLASLEKRLEKTSGD